MNSMLAETRRRRIILNMPRPIARLMAGAFDLAQTLTGGLFTNRLLTRDQLRNLARDNVVSEGAQGFAELGITPTPMELILPSYLWRFRKSGQYVAIRESAEGLRSHE